MSMPCKADIYKDVLCTSQAKCERSVNSFGLLLNSLLLPQFCAVLVAIEMGSLDGMPPYWGRRGLEGEQRCSCTNLLSSRVYILGFKRAAFPVTFTYLSYYGFGEF